MKFFSYVLIISMILNSVISSSTLGMESAKKSTSITVSPRRSSPKVKVLSPTEQLQIWALIGQFIASKQLRQPLVFPDFSRKSTSEQPVKSSAPCAQKVSSPLDHPDFVPFATSVGEIADSLTTEKGAQDSTPTARAREVRPLLSNSFRWAIAAGLFPAVAAWESPSDTIEALARAAAESAAKTATNQAFEHAVNQFFQECEKRVGTIDLTNFNIPPQMMQAVGRELTRGILNELSTLSPEEAGGFARNFSSILMEGYGPALHELAKNISTTIGKNAIKAAGEGFWSFLYPILGISIGVMSFYYGFKMTYRKYCERPPNLASKVWESNGKKAPEISEELVFNQDIQDEFANYVHRIEVARSNKQPLPNLLLYGPPGTGKTDGAVRHMRAQGISLHLIGGGDMAKYSVQEAVRVLNEFMEILKSKPGLHAVLFDEAEAVFAVRRSGHASPLLNQFLTLTGSKGNQNYLFIATTNHVSQIDQAVFRRLGTRVEVTLPDLGSREKLFRTYVKKYMPKLFPTAGDIPEEMRTTLITLAGQTEGFSPAEIQEITLEAAQDSEETEDSRDARGQGVPLGKRFLAKLIQRAQRVIAFKQSTNKQVPPVEAPTTSRSSDSGSDRGRQPSPSDASRSD